MPCPPSRSAWAQPWPERRIEHTYCAYCKRRHLEGRSSCEGCGAPITAPGRIEALQEKLDAGDGDELIEVTTFGDAKPQFIRAPRLVLR